MAAMQSQSRPWWHGAVIYQIYPRSFQDSSGDGIGDLAGVIDRLDYLSDTLGVDAIWLSPFYRSPMDDCGYDVSDHTDVDPVFGDLATFDRLVAEAHRRDIKVLVDFVPNHTSDRHPWFIESRRARDSARRDWYVWADPAPGGGPPNNWVSIWGGPAWTLDPITGQYYQHSFLPSMPELNWRNPDVVDAMFDVVRFWIDRGVDGFRIDCAHLIMKDPDLADNPPNPRPGAEMHRSLGAEFDSQLHVNDRGHADVHDIFRRLRRLLDHPDHGRPLVSIGEIHDFEWPRWAGYYGAGLDELHMPFNFGLLGVEWEAGAVRHLVDTVEAAVPPGAWPNWVLGNHDEPRIASRVGEERARQAMMLLLTLRGTPTIYYGDELAMPNADIPAGAAVDPWELRLPGLGLGRDPERSPMIWSAKPNAGFCPPDLAPWLPLIDGHEARSVEAQLRDPASILSLTRHLLHLRRTNTALHHGSYRPIDTPNPDCFVFLRERGEERFLIALNFSAEDRQLDLSALGRGTLAASTLESARAEPQEPLDLASLHLRGSEGTLILIA
jgi:glycosidase